MTGEIGVYIALFVALYFEVFLFVTFFEKIPNLRDPKEKLSYYPSVTILVPCFNEEKTLKGTLDSLLALDYPKDKLFISVIDDGSRDSTLAIARTFETEPQITVFTKENGGKFTALNLGIKEAQTELVGCLDADSFVAPDALVEIVKKFNANPQAMAVTPAIKIHKPSRLIEYMQATEYTFGIFYKKMFDNLSAIPILPGPFSIYRREAFDQIGLFRHAHNTEDMEITLRMHKHHLKIENAHTAYVYTTPPKTIWSLVKQRTRWTQGFIQNSKDYRFMYGNPAYGNLGLFVLPFGFFSIFAGLYLAGYSLYTLLSYITERLLSAVATGIVPTPSFFSGEFTWFFLQTSVTTFLVLIAISMTLTIIFIGRKMSEGTVGIRDVLSYLVLYGFVAPLWLARAVYGAVRSRESIWR